MMIESIVEELLTSCGKDGSLVVRPFVIETYQWMTMIGLSLLMVLIAKGFIFDKIKTSKGLIPFALFWAYVVIYCLWIFAYPPIQYGQYQGAFMDSASRVFSEVILIPIGIFYFPKRLFLFSLHIFCGVELALVLTKGYGFLGAPSFSLAFCACAIPFLHYTFSLVVVGAILSMHALTASSILCAQILVSIFLGGFGRLKDKSTIRLLKFTSIIIISIFAYYHRGDISYAHGRLDTWLSFIQYWKSRGLEVWSFGTGPGSFVWISPALQQFQYAIYSQMHNDWLQILFEEGVIGFVLALLCAFHAGWVVRDNPKYLGAVASVCVFGLTYYPLRFLPSALLVAFIFRVCLESKYKWLRTP